MNKYLIFLFIFALVALGSFIFYRNNLLAPRNPEIPEQSSSVGETNNPTIEGSNVTIENFAFTPQTITAKKGATVTWTNQDRVGHNVADDPEEKVFKSQVLAQGQSFSFTFQESGEYNYYCPLHPSMKGKIVVE